MAFLPPSNLSLTGGCFCGAAKYTITIPALSERPLVPNAAPVSTSPTETTPTRLPIITLDHCQTCRRVSGAIITCWLIVPPSWLTWTLLNRDGSERRDIPAVEVCGPADAGTQGDHYVQHFRSSDRVIRTFCERCGTHLTYYGLRRHGTPGAFVDVSVGSLDAGSFEVVRPERHNWWENGVEWVRELVRWGTGGWVMRNPTGDPAQIMSSDEG